MQTRTIAEIESVLRPFRQSLAREYGVVSMGIFGLYARNEADVESDVDILVEFDRAIGFFKFLELEERLAGLLGTKVDLVTRAALKPHIGRHILQEVVNF